MNRYPKYILGVAFVSLGLLVAAPARAAASLTQVSRSTWTAGVSLPSYVEMYIYVPTTVATKPPIVVSAHSCGSTASGQIGKITHFVAASDKNGFILILPDNPNQNCWDVGSDKSLKHDGGGDTQAVAQMVKYALSKYNGDASRVYIFGGSSGGILTQGMLAVYPDVFKAGSARAGAPAGCWAVSYDPSPSQEWSGPCAGGSVTKTAQQWGDLVRAMDPGYSGHRPRVQLIQGEADTTINYKNMAESIKEWTNVLGLSETPTSTDKGFQGQVAAYDRQFWKNACGYTVLEAWSAPGKDHSMDYEEDAMLKFFGLDVAVGSDPEPDCTGDGGVVSGTGGVNGSGGTTGAGSGGGGKDGGPGGKDGGNDVAMPGSGGVQGSSSGSGGVQGSGGSAKGGAGGGGGTVGNGGSSGSGATSAKGGTSGNGGTSASGGSMGSGGSSAKGGSGGESSGGTQGNGGSSARGGNTGTGGSTAGGTTSSGCSCTVGRYGERSVPHFALLLLAALGLILRRQRRIPR